MLNKQYFTWLIRTNSILLLLIFGIAGYCNGQEFLVQSFGSKQGLASSEIYTLTQDAEGYLWLGTKLGVSKFDGQQFKNFNGSDSVLFGKVYAITQDADKTIWVGAENGLFFLQQGVFQHVQFDSKFPDNWVYSLLATSSNDLWIGTSDGPIFIDNQTKNRIKKGSILNYTILSGWLDVSTVSNQVWVIQSHVVNNKQAIYFGTRRSVINYSEKKLNIIWDGKGQRLEDVSGIQFDNCGVTYISTRSGSFYKIKGSQLDSIFTLTYATSMAQMSDSVNYALGLEGVYAVSDKQIKKITEIASLGYDSPSCILIDKEKNIWIGTWEGLVQLRKNIFQTWLPAQTENLNDIFSIIESPQGKMVLGGNRGNLIQFNGVGFDKVLPPGIQPWPLSEVFGIYYNADNSIWLGSGYQGMSVFAHNQIFHYDESILNDSHAHGFFHDKKNNFYALSEGGITQILNEHNPKNLAFTYIPWPIHVGGQFLKTFDNVVFENNEIFFATNFGIVYFDGDSLYAVKTGNQWLDNGLITAIKHEENNVVWVSTGNNGIFKVQLSKRNGKVLEHLDNTNGLLANAVLDIIYDDKSKFIWCAHYNGLSAVKLNNNAPQVVKKITESEGFLPYDFTYCKLGLQRNGQFIWLVTTNGVQRFSIKDLKINAIPATPVITEVLLFNDARAVGDYTKLFNQVNGLYLSPNFPHNKNSISFKFQSVSLTIPELNQCRYKLIGYNEEWTYTANIGEVTYAALPPGDYVFVLEAANNDNYWSEQQNSYPFSIAKPFWETAWFIIAAILTTIGLSYAIYRYRLSQFIKISNIRNKIAGDLHDDIGSTLSSIGMYSEIVRNQVKQNSSVNDELLGKITANSKEMIDNMSDIVWAIKPENDELKNIESRMFNFATEMCNLKGVELNMPLGTITEKLSIKMEQRRDFYLLFKEAVNNAIKYSGCKTLSVIFTQKQRTLVLSIADDGKGFDLNQQSLGNGLRNMQSRAQRHGGVCIIDSVPGQGTNITINWPLT